LYQDHKINIRQYVCKYHTKFIIIYQYKYYKYVFEEGQTLRHITPICQTDIIKSHILKSFITL